jgi:hypothetical protein
LLVSNKFISIKPDELDEQEGKVNILEELFLYALVVPVARISYQWIVAKLYIPARKGSPRLIAI